MSNNKALAIVPKARAVFARRLTPEKYAELTRKSSVPQVAKALKAMPGFRKTLATLSEDAPHRGQLEELLRSGVFYEYEELMRYHFGGPGFGVYFIWKCETEELLAKLQLVSVGRAERYITRMPAFLMKRSRFDLLALARAETLSDCLNVVRGTPYFETLGAVLSVRQEEFDLLLAERTLKNQYYASVFALAEKTLSPHDAKEVGRLFCMEADVENLDVLYRLKAYYPHAVPPAPLEELLLPYGEYISAAAKRRLCGAKDLPGLLAAYADTRAARAYGPADPPNGTPGGQAYLAAAQRLLRGTVSPDAALTAALAIEQQQERNIIHIIEGVRYGLAPEQIERFIIY